MPMSQSPTKTEALPRTRYFQDQILFSDEIYFRMFYIIPHNNDII